MGRKPCCDKVGLKRGPWTIEEDHKLMNFILNNGIHCWRMVPKLAGLLRCGKSCRLRWINYLRPDLKRGGFTESEEDQIMELHSRLGNRWSKIASYFPGRTDNEIKNHWNTRIKKKMKVLGLDPLTHEPVQQVVVDDKTDTDHHEKEETKQDSATSLSDNNKEPEGEIDPKENDIGKPEMTVSEKTADDCLSDNYELLCDGFDLESLLLTQETRGSNSSFSNCSIFSMEESNNSSLSINETSPLQEDMSSLNQWIETVDPLFSWDFLCNLEDNLFHFGK